jgi:glycosyltransferase involved in cell wall biosynthesis
MSLNPKVTFVIPCYNLGHYLAECVDSLLSQTYDNFEVLIMDDCSPDETPEVAQSFKDARVKHIRNKNNLGHLNNYNRGIELARGEYVWLISADDRLRRPYALARYLGLADVRSTIGYVISPGVEMENGIETRLGVYSVLSNHDTVLGGHEFLGTLLNSNSIIAASGMVRKSCYDSWGAFPLNMPYAGDWYLWCLFAMHTDVGYIAEPLVNYRAHPMSMTNSLLQTNIETCAADDTAVLWEIKRKAEQAGFGAVVRRSRHAIAYNYARQVTGCMFRNSRYETSITNVEASMSAYASSDDEFSWIRAFFYVALGDRYVSLKSFGEAAEFYGRALTEHPTMLKVRVKKALLFTGTAGLAFRRSLGGLRKLVS